MSDKQLDDVFMQLPQHKVFHRLRVLEPQFPWMEAESKKSGDTLDLLWREYQINQPDGYNTSQLKKYFQAWKRRTNPNMYFEPKADDTKFMDFTGGKLQKTHPATGEVTAAEVFVAILGARQLIYVEAVKRKKTSFQRA